MENGVRYIKYAHISTGLDQNWIDGTKTEIFNQVEQFSIKNEISFSLKPIKIKY